MAKPRVFISSTFYDLKQIREDLERSIRELGYEPIRNETGSIAYGKDSAPETYAYKELELCDILVSIIGGRYGSESREETGYSISQVELKRALERGIQVFIFIEKHVNAEYQTYKLNKENDSVKYQFVDNKKIYCFIDFVHELPCNNPISTFEISADITDYLRIQWAGLFHRFLQEERRLAELRVLDEMKSVSSTLKDLVTFLTADRRNSDEAIRSILQANHPAFRRFADLTKTPYRVYFTDIDELGRWLKAKGWTELSEIVWDDDEHPEWKSRDENAYISYFKGIFNEDGKLRLFTESEWSDSWVRLREDVPKASPSPTAVSLGKTVSTSAPNSPRPSPLRPPASAPTGYRPPPSRLPASASDDDDDIPF